MTVEVAVINTQGIALAADSAATSGSGSRQKIFNTVKLFTLSKVHPVGIMTYSSADVMGLPVETAIKVFRQSLGTRELDKLEDYASEFKNFLFDNNEVFSEVRRNQHCADVIHGEILRFRDEIMQALGESLDGWQGHSDDSVKLTALECLQSHRAEYAAAKLLPGSNKANRDRLNKFIGPLVNELRDKMCSSFGLTTKDIPWFKSLCSNIIWRDLRPRSETGFVIAGFGKYDYLPKLVSFEFVLSVSGVHKCFDVVNIDIETAKSKAQIVPFAQPDMVETFVRGRSQRFDRELIRCAQTYFEEEIQSEWVQEIADQKTREGIIEMLQANKNDMSRKMQKLLEDFTLRNYVWPLESTVNVLPKSDLAVMAEALVNLTAMKRRVTRTQETVGGPIDVAVISKGDGFVWIKRKYYFDEGLNQPFVQNYLKGLGGEPNEAAN